VKPTKNPHKNSIILDALSLFTKSSMKYAI